MTNLGIPQIVAQRPVVRDTVQLTVSTIRIDRDHYDTVVFDDSADQRHVGMVIAGHENEGRQFGPYVIGHSNVPSGSRDEAMEQHREALYAARTETPKAVTR